MRSLSIPRGVVSFDPIFYAYRTPDLSHSGYCFISVHIGPKSLFLALFTSSISSRLLGLHGLYWGFEVIRVMWEITSHYGRENNLKYKMCLSLKSPLLHCSAPALACRPYRLLPCSPVAWMFLPLQALSHLACCNQT